MANESTGAAQNKLGELFVEFGSKGLGGLLKGLNGIQAQFLLTKNAAQQAFKPLENMSKNAAKSVVNYDKLNAILGLTPKQLQNLDIWAKLNNADLGTLSGQIGQLQQDLLNLAQGKGMSEGWAKLGIDPRQFSYKEPLKAFDAILQRISQMDEATAALALTELGYSKE